MVRKRESSKRRRLAMVYELAAIKVVLDEEMVVRPTAPITAAGERARRGGGKDKKRGDQKKGGQFTKGSQPNKE